MLGNLSVSGRPTNLYNSGARTYCACSRRAWGLFKHFSPVYIFSFHSPSLGDGPIQTEILSQQKLGRNISIFLSTSSLPAIYHGISPVKLWENLKQIATKGFFAVMIFLDLHF